MFVASCSELDSHVLVYNVEQNMFIHSSSVGAPLTHSFTPRGNAKLPIYLVECVWEVEGNRRTRRKTHTRTETTQT